MMFDRLNRDDDRDDLTAYIEALAADELGRVSLLRLHGVVLTEDRYVDPFDLLDDERERSERTA